MYLYVTPDHVYNMSEERFLHIMRRLLTAETYRCDGDQSKVVVNAKSKTPDKGSDGFSPLAKKPSRWLGETDVCWQFKSGKSSQPNKIKNEILKDRPKQILQSGGSYVLVAQAAEHSGRDKRLKTLQDEAKLNDLPIDRIDVFTSEQLATWINEHPSIACEVLEISPAFFCFKDWAKNPMHADRFVKSKAMDEIITLVHETLKMKSELTSHVHIHGCPGIGKTRLAIEICRTAEWQEEVIYIPEGQEPIVHELLLMAKNNTAQRFILVLENRSITVLRHLNELLRLANGRVRLISIGLESIDDERSILSIPVVALNRDDLSFLIQERFPDMKREHRNYVVQEADGYIGWAINLANLLSEDPLLFQSAPTHIRQKLIESFLGGISDITPLMALSITEVMGWRGSKAVEGRFVMEYLGFNWPGVQAKLHCINKNYSIAPIIGNSRCISPAPLAHILAGHAWEAWPDLLEELLDKLPLDATKNKIYSRLKKVVQYSPMAREYSLRALYELRLLDDINTSQKIFRLSCIAAVNPIMAAQKIRYILEKSTAEGLAKLTPDAKAALNDMLTAMAKIGNAFEDSIFALLVLVEIDTECAESDIKNEFIFAFSPFLGATSKPYQDRLSVLDALLDQGNKYMKLVISALGQALAASGVRIEVPSITHFSLETEWEPNQLGYLNAVRVSLERLVKIANTCSKEYAKDLIRVAKSGIWLLLTTDLVDHFVEYIKALFKLYPFECEDVEVEIAEFLTGQGKAAGKTLKKVQKLLQQIRNPDQAARLRVLMQRRVVNQDSLLEEISNAASLLINNRELLWSLWEWMTSGNSWNSQMLGKQLGKIDKDHSLLHAITTRSGSGPDLHISIGYLEGYAEIVGQDNLENFLDDLEKETSVEERAVLEFTCLVSQNDRAGNRVIRLARRQQLSSEGIQKIVHTTWVKALSKSVFLELLTEIDNCPENASSDVVLLEKWVNSDPKKLELVENRALEIVSKDSVILNTKVEPRWSNLVAHLLPKHARTIFKAVLGVLSVPCDVSIILRKTQSGVLLRCVEIDPSGCWEELKNKLIESPSATHLRFRLQAGLVDLLPNKMILDWIRIKPSFHGEQIIYLCRLDLADSSLFANIIESFSDVPEVLAAARAKFSSGSWTGTLSSAIGDQAALLISIADKTHMRRFKNWVLSTAYELQMLSSRLLKEEEDKLP